MFLFSPDLSASVLNAQTFQEKMEILLDEEIGLHVN